MKTLFGWILIAAVLFSGCTGTNQTSVSDELNNSATAESLEISHQNLEPDSSSLSLINQYRDTLMVVMGEPLTTLKADLNFGKPESTLGNLMADILRFRAARELRTFVHLGIINEDSFNLYLNEGEVTLGNIYELMPYNNHLVIVTLTGEKVNQLMETVASLGGAPVSGVRMNITEGTARGVLVNSEVVDPGKNYLVATSNYLADGNGPFNTLWEYDDRVDLDLLIRDSFIEYFKNQYELEPVLDARIRE
jgi:2',3'-cyclic-nucleotide 2'-phosphodiesterase (5'-nucleotidase family)